MLAGLATIDETRQVFGKIPAHCVLELPFIGVAAGKETPAGHLHEKHPTGVTAHTFDFFFAKEPVQARKPSLSKALSSCP